MVDFTWPWAKDKESEVHKIKTISLFMSFFFVINYTLGTGFLGIPYSFFYSGFVIAVPTLFLIMLTTLINGNYILESMARAQVSLLDHIRSMAILTGIELDIIYYYNNNNYYSC